jgi:predicted TIM-barrel fold metal-dependent hydrolase
MPVTADFEAYLSDDWYGHPMTVEALLECEAEAGFDFAVVMPQTKVDPDNDGLLERTAGNPNLLPCVMMNPHLGESGIDQLKGFVERGAKGMKLMGAIHDFDVDDPMVMPFVEAASTLGIVVSIHSDKANCSADRFAAVAGKFPEVPIIMDHMGFPDHFDEGLDVCRDHTNVYMGTTILRFHTRWAQNPEETVPSELKIAVEVLGPERVVFGSNLPEYRPIQVKRAIQRLDLGAKAEALIFGENLARIYGI